MTDARLAGDVAQVALVVDPTTVHARLAGDAAQVALIVDPTTISARVAGLVAQVAFQVKRSNVVDLVTGKPMMDLSTGTPIHIQTLT